MSDRRPEKRPRTKYPMTEFMKLVDCPAESPHAESCECGGYQYWTEAATLPELLAVVRRGVESGTIKGSFRQWHQPITVQPKDRPDLADDLPAGRYIIIGPVSDGGSET